MTRGSAESERLHFVQEVTRLGVRYLTLADARLFPSLMTETQALSLPNEPELAERVDAFVARFGRLQDGLGDKVLPALLRGLGEPVGPIIYSLACAERWNWLSSADDWLRVRHLRNQMIHEYVKDPLTGDEYLAWEALQMGMHEFLHGEVYATAGAEAGHMTTSLNVAIAMR